ncbi:hypothetical protein [Chryseobacterium oranimense]|uniref:hypothetical protein n=1 Tax=Chryseobacterium oranimense TaxID=421058 RepID=UPI0022368D18|nr:hypothetical protein [Chryseobacterium oranimense]
MCNYICYLKGKKEDSQIIKMLYDVFKCEKELIGNLFDTQKNDIRFENRLLDDVSEFCTELNVYVDDNINKVTFNNNFLFGYEVSKYFDEDIIIGSRNDDPYEWILIKNNLFFIVEEVDDENSGITLQKSSNMEISYDQAILISS